MILGEFNYKLDSGGRITFSKKLLEYFKDNKVYLTSTDNVTHMYSESGFMSMLDSLKELDLPHQVKIKNSICSNTCVCYIDKQKRLLIPLNLRETLGNEITIIGVVDRFEIWNKGIYESVVRRERLEYLCESKDLLFPNIPVHSLKKN